MTGGFISVFLGLFQGQLPAVCKPWGLRKVVFLESKVFFLRSDELLVLNRLHDRVLLRVEKQVLYAFLLALLHASIFDPVVVEVLFLVHREVPFTFLVAQF